MISLLVFVPLRMLHHTSPFADDVRFALELATVFAFVSYSAGQLVGQSVRSPIVASFLACVLSALMAGWVSCLRMLPLPFGVELVPAFILLGASWLRSRDWLEDRKSTRLNSSHG